MPFTFAHPAVVIPFCKKQRYVSITALVLGSMAPDFEYFLHFRPYGVIGHTWLGFFYLNLPLVFILAYIYHYIVKRPFIEHLPWPFSIYYCNVASIPWKLTSWKEIFVFLYSALFGMLTHVVWDAFTHKTGYFVMNLPFLQQSIYSIPIYKFMQHGSTCLGFVLITFVLLKYRDSQSKVDRISVREKRKYWGWSMITALGAFIAHALLDPYFQILQIGSIIVSGLTSVFCGIFIVSAVYKIRE
ncbi:DUF4184 family protein [Paenibacillus sp. 102]|uniref:DUF4184 family protein n=1 Tax=Paenibacillus sp. 102 TaxID=3120823 RepID=UPI0031B9C562